MKLGKRMIGFSVITAMVFSLTACTGTNDKEATKATGTNEVSENSVVPTIDAIHLGEDYQDLSASIKILTNRTDIVDTVYKGYAEEFMKLYPNIKVTYEAVTDYEESLNLRLTAGDWGDICFIPTSVDKSELPQYFITFGAFDTLNKIYNFCSEKTFNGQQYGIANGGTAGGIVYNKKVWEKAGIKEVPKTPDAFLECLQQIKENTDAIPLYSNFAAGWPMGQWDSYIGITATGSPDFMNDIVHIKNPFEKNEQMTGPYAVYYVLYEAVHRGLIEEDPASSDWESSKSLLNNGEISSMVLGSWAVQQCKDAGANADDVAYMPFPITVEGTQYAGAGGNYSFGINNRVSTQNQIASMLYVKWLIEESSIYEDEGSIPALKSKELPKTLADFEGVELLSNNPAKEGEEDFFEEVNNESEIGINKNDYTKSEILEAALYGTKTLDEIMDDWNTRWTNAQVVLGMQVQE